MATKKELDLLEKAFVAEIEYALERKEKFCLPFMQTKSRLAERMVEAGLLQREEMTVGGIHFKGYGQTFLGNMTYCMSCSDVDVEAEDEQKTV